jgi:RND family efflux transporter MFP subunit
MLLALGCGGEQVRKDPPPPEVLVSRPLSRAVSDYEIFTGRTESSQRVELRSRITGYLEKTYFQEGELVEENAVLFLIDPKPYQAEMARAEASLAQAKAHLRRLEGDFDRAQSLLNRQAIGREEYEKLRGERDEAKAGVGVAEAVVKLAQNSLHYTEIRAPFRGRISRRMVDPGNLVKADETLLTVLVAEEPIYAYFDVDERTFLRQLLRGGRLDSTLSERVPVQFGLADETGFPHPAVVNFVDNRLESGTGSLWLRAQFLDPQLAIRPGMFIRVKFPLGSPYKATVIAEQALGTDQGQKFVYVVNHQNRIEYRPVQAGRLQDDGMRVIAEGLKPDERIVVTGLQRVRAGAVVTPKAVEMESATAVARR